MTKEMSAEASAALVRDGTTVLIDGSGGGVNESGLVLAALESRFVRECHPAALTVVHPSGVGDGKGGVIDRFAHPGMVSKVIAHIGTGRPACNAWPPPKRLRRTVFRKVCSPTCSAPSPVTLRA